ncbi:hypothetical protein [Gordonia shandongensis]|uniref:hypothetical protein n=1 Tax=Gordonia shandongensis TaxID=376351 RepID=UPI000426F271|nr:hypothetical protein [Gordonia shandongensis]
MTRGSTTRTRAARIGAAVFGIAYFVGFCFYAFGGDGTNLIFDSDRGSAGSLGWTFAAVAAGLVLMVAVAGVGAVIGRLVDTLVHPGSRRHEACG